MLNLRSIWRVADIKGQQLRGGAQESFGTKVPQEDAALRLPFQVYPQPV